MGQSTNAVLFYGYCWDKETSRPWEIGRSDQEQREKAKDERGEGWEERYARVKGCLAPSIPFPERMVTATRENGWSRTPTDYNVEEQAIIDQYKVYWSAKEKLVEASSCCVEVFCSTACPMPYVAVKASLTTCWRGHMEEIFSLDVDSSWERVLADFCTTLDIKTEGKKAAWWMVSFWGMG